MEGRPPKSKALFFRFPYEILSIILGHIDDSSLASLALVDRDCQQLARSCQFSSVVLDYSDNAFQLLNTLTIETIQRSKNQDMTAQPSIGACIRRITVKTHPEWLTYLHGIKYSPDFDSLDEEEKMTRLIRANAMYYDYYLETIKWLFESRVTWPHLELLDWKDNLYSLSTFSTASPNPEFST
jgi:hypothetical protein